MSNKTNNYFMSLKEEDRKTLVSLKKIKMNF